MLRLVVLTVLALGAGSGLVACSDTDRDPEGGGGQGAGADGGGTSGNGALSVCERFCKTTGVCFPDCEKTCEDFQAPPCEAEGLAYVKCLSEPEYWDAQACKQVDHTEYDAKAQACFDATFLFQECKRINPPTGCAANQCAGDASHCGCIRECDGGTQHAICDSIGGMVTCECYLNSIIVLGCSDVPQPNGDNCNLELGCCGLAFGYGP